MLCHKHTFLQKHTIKKLKGELLTNAVVSGLVHALSFGVKMAKI